MGERTIASGVLALRMKPIIEARAKEQQLRKPESVSPISDEQTSDIFTNEVQPVPPAKAAFFSVVCFDNLKRYKRPKKGRFSLHYLIHS